MVIFNIQTTTTRQLTIWLPRGYFPLSTPNRAPVCALQYYYSLIVMLPPDRSKSRTDYAAVTVEAGVTRCV
jgi:hypothetical protein